jgi:hypothetical protein
VLVVGLASLGPIGAGAQGTRGGSASVHAAAKRPGRASAPCTKRALEAAMKRGRTHARLASKHSFGCSGGFAYAFAIAATGKAGFEENLLFKAAGRRWNVVSRAKYCKKPVVPARIKKAVCFSS